MIDSELTIRKLEIFLAFMEKKNMARTAEALGLSSVSVHRALHSLEEVLRCPLYASDGAESCALFQRQPYTGALRRRVLMVQPSRHRGDTAGGRIWQWADEAGLPLFADA